MVNKFLLVLTQAFLLELLVEEHGCFAVVLFGLDILALESDVGGDVTEALR